MCGSIEYVLKHVLYKVLYVYFYYVCAEESDNERFAPLMRSLLFARLPLAAFATLRYMISFLAQYAASLIRLCLLLLLRYFPSPCINQT